MDGGSTDVHKIHKAGRPAGGGSPSNLDLALSKFQRGLDLTRSCAEAGE